MRPQTLLDISSRTSASAGVIRELGQFGGGEFNQQMGGWIFRFNPIVELITGPPCELWSLFIKMRGQGEFRVSGVCNATVVEPDSVTIHGVRPLFPRMPARACQTNIELWSRSESEVEVSLSVGAAHPVVETLTFTL
jgi:hypothetical protein